MPKGQKDKAAEIVVALAGSAADTAALERFLARLTLPDEATVVIVLQHREALDDEAFKRALADQGRTLSPIVHGARIEAGRIYLPDGNLIVTAEDGRFQTRPALQSPGERGTVDSFLVSLAGAEDGRTIAVLFTLLGGDGTLGVAAVKEAGGLALAEASEERRAGDLSVSNSPAAIADFILPAEELAEQVTLQARQLASRTESPAQPDAAVSAALTDVATILRNRTGHDFHGYKSGTFLRRVQRRMQVARAQDIAKYVEVLRAEPDEALLLFNDLLIGVTHFFRDRKEFELLEREVIPKLFEGKQRGDQLRVWVIGCSTGEEAYSIAILLREHIAMLDDVPQVQIFASDLDGRALATARAGRYADTIEADLSPQRLARWFVKEGNTYCVVKELREMCIFSQHSVIKDAPFSRLDLISCRNLLIYLDADLQNRVIPLFHFALRPHGVLFLGNSENVSRHTTLFAAIESRSRIYRRLDNGTRVLPDLPFAAVDRRLVEAAALTVRPRGVEGGLARRAERIAERYAPAYVVTDDAFQVLHFSGRTGRYLEPAGGAASLNLLNLVHPDLRLDLRAALDKAVHDNTAVQADNLGMGVDGRRIPVDLVIEPIQDAPALARSFVVIFKDGTAPAVAAEAPDSPLLRDERIQRLERELRTSHERLQATVEELESTNEELKSSNEEYQSLNEELQSANEELETSKEELQSVNEELTTVNGELGHRVQELGRTNSDMKNLLASTQIATIFLDHDLRIMNFTPSATELFHLVETDLGRPLGHIKSEIAYEELEEDVRRVLRTLGPVDREVASPATGTRYMARVLPYRSIDNYIGGVVVTFTDLTPMARAQQALHESERQARLFLAELQHRVRNTLALVRSIARRTADTSETVKEYATNLDGRIEAFSRVQAAFTRDPLAGVDLETLVADELRAHGALDGHQVNVKGPKAPLKPKAAELLALAIHELTTNAVKYGALSSASGRIDVVWAIDEANGRRRLVFRWGETGATPANGPPKRRGFGTELIERTLTYDLEGEATLRLEPDGLQCVIAIPVTDRLLLDDQADSAPAS